MYDDAKAPVSLNYDDKAAAANLPMLEAMLSQTYTLVPGYPLTDDIYDYQMSQLARIGFRTISLQLYGFSRIRSPIEMYNYHLVSADLTAITHHLDLNAVKLHGRTVGGAVSIHYAVVRHGRLVNRLALFAAPASPSSMPAFHLSSKDATSYWDSIEAIDGLLPFVTGESDPHLVAKRETIINVGVATWFLYQGHQSA